jgi:hypothetical protein
MNVIVLVERLKIAKNVWCSVDELQQWFNQRTLIVRDDNDLHGEHVSVHAAGYLRVKKRCTIVHLFFFVLKPVIV